MDTPYVAVARIDAIQPGQFVKIAVEGQAIILANADGHFYAVEDRCSHEDYPLSLGCLDGDRIKCPLHGSRFELDTGKPMDEPADEPILTFRVRLADDWVWIDPTSRTD